MLLSPFWISLVEQQSSLLPPTSAAATGIATGTESQPVTLSGLDGDGVSACCSAEATSAMVEGTESVEDKYRVYSILRELGKLFRLVA